MKYSMKMYLVVNVLIAVCLLPTLFVSEVIGLILMNGFMLFLPISSTLLIWMFINESRVTKREDFRYTNILMLDSFIFSILLLVFTNSMVLIKWDNVGVIMYYVLMFLFVWYKNNRMEKHLAEFKAEYDKTMGETK